MNTHYDGRLLEANESIIGLAQTIGGHVIEVVKDKQRDIKTIIQYDKSTKKHSTFYLLELTPPEANKLGRMLAED